MIEDSYDSFKYIVSKGGMNMDLNKSTQKSLQAVQDCQKLAYQYGNQKIEQEHLLLSLLTQEDSLIDRLQYSVVHGHTGHLLRRLSGWRTAYKRRICPNRFTGNRPVCGHGNDLRGYDEPAVRKGWFLIDG